ncbi:MAG TPA: hypothetical protein PLX85_00835 [Dehalococcoidia bacterium]|nr:hypothetical protein [Dehalococcoidia bacterium]
MAEAGVVGGAAGARSAPRSGLRALHLLLAAQSAIVILVGVNRRTDLTVGYVASNEFLRWVDLINMLALPMASVVASVLLKRWLEARVGGSEASERGERMRWALPVLDIVFLLGVYVLAASYGTHEVTNYLHVRFCDGDSGRLCEIIAFNDDSFSHWLFFTGFVVINLVILALQALARATPDARGADLALVSVNALFIASGIFVNLAFEETGFDLPVVALLFVVSAALWWRARRRPLFVYYAVAYGVGLFATGLYKVA